MSVVGGQRVIGPLSPGTSAYTEDVDFSHPGGSSTLRCTYERDGRMYTGGLHFFKVRAYRFRTELYCTSWHIKEAYDTLVEVVPSDWVAELLADEPDQPGVRWTLRHFMIYIDSAGAYEVVAEDVEWLPERPAS